MLIKLRIFLIFIVFTSVYSGRDINIGLILRNNDSSVENIVTEVIKKELSWLPEGFIYNVIKEEVADDNALDYLNAVCKLFKKGVVAYISPSTSVAYPILKLYSHIHHLPQVVPALAIDTSVWGNHTFGIAPSTLRAMMDLIRDQECLNLVYIYDDMPGEEYLQIIFLVSPNVMKLRILGILKTTSATDAVRYFRKVEKQIHGKICVVLYTEETLTVDILLRHLHDASHWKKYYQFFIAHPTMRHFWTQNDLGSLNVTGFLSVHPNVNRNGVEYAENKIIKQHSNQKYKISDYYYNDAALVVAKTVLDIIRDPRYSFPNPITPKESCFNASSKLDDLFCRMLQEVDVENGETGQIQFSNDFVNRRKNLKLRIVKSVKKKKYVEIGVWKERLSLGGLQFLNLPSSDDAEASSLKKNIWNVSTIISPPYMMLKSVENNSTLLAGNDRFEGFCKDLMDSISDYLNVGYSLQIVQDRSYGTFDERRGRWTGMIGELVQNNVHVALGDLAITLKRQQAVDFADPFEVTSLCLVLKHPDSDVASSSKYFIFNAFKSNIWICVVFSLIIFTVLLHFINQFTSAPDSIESASGIWGRKNNVIMNVWFAIGTTLGQGTGVYPRALSSRILSEIWWFFTLIFGSFFVASLITQLRLKDIGDKSPQLQQLKALSVESVLLESLKNGWPAIGIVSPSITYTYIKKSTVPLYIKLSAYLDSHPEMIVRSAEEGVEKVGKSNGDYILLMSSTSADYFIRQEPCDITTIHNDFPYASFGIAVSTEYSLKHFINDALINITESGLLGKLQHKWWIENSQCKTGKRKAPQNMFHAFSGVLYIVLIGLLLFLLVFGFQYLRKSKNKENRRQQLVFDDLNMDSRYPTPPPEMLQPLPTLNPPEVQSGSTTDRESSTSFKEYFDRMKKDPETKISAL